MALDHRPLLGDGLAVTSNAAVVDEMGRVAAADTIVVDLGARAARPRVAHLPKIVLHVAREDALARHVLGPDLPRLEVRGHALSLIALKVGDVEPVLGDLVHLGQQRPRPLDRFLLEVVTETPVAEHLEEGVVVIVFAHVIEVIVLAARADALLRVGGALELRHGRVGVAPAQEMRLELGHARVDEEQRGVV